MTGRTISHYRILGQLGEGGMGVVYKAEDLRLGRAVALKFLPSGMLEDEAHGARFLREARAAAMLDHPNICTVYEVDEVDGRTLLAMSCLEGQTLQKKIASRPLLLQEAIDISLQIGQGLQAAHEKGIIHRDIKPGNIMITAQGHVKIMDFGLAQLADRTKLTMTGMKLGTPAYMSPEQTEGKPVDRRTDVWALGVVLYEMISGRLPFGGETEAAVSYAIVHHEPEPLTALRSGLPIGIDRIVGKVLAKTPDERYQHIDDFAVDLKDLQEKKPASGKGASIVSPPVSRWKRMAPWVLTALMAFAWILAFARMRRSSDPAASPVEFAVVFPEGVQPLMSAISPDGRRLAAATRTGGLWVRDLDSLKPRPIAGTEGARYPFWSPDGRYIGFFAQGKLKKVSLTGGVPQSLCDAADGRGGSWSRKGVILFAPSPNGELFRVGEEGGDPAPVTSGLDPAKPGGRRFPYFLPDGQHFLYTGGGQQPVEQLAVYLGSLSGGAPKLLLPHHSNAAFVPGPGSGPGHVLFVNNQNLMARPFDAGGLEFAGSVFPVVEPVASGANVGFYGFSASASGALATLNANTYGTSQLAWFDKRGKMLETVGEPGTIFNVALSPNTRQAAIAMISQGANQSDLWVIDLGRKTFSRFTSSPRPENAPVWSPRGDRIAFNWMQTSDSQIFQKDAGGGGEPEALPGVVKLRMGEWLQDWSPDGRFMIVSQRADNGKEDLWVRSVLGQTEPYPFLVTEFAETEAQFSPDGKWVGYQSDKSGRPEIYVRAFSKTDLEWKISSDGGSVARWRRDGKALYFLAPDGSLMAVSIRTAAGVESGVPQPLFKVNVADFGGMQVRPVPYAVTPDGQRFLVIVRSEDRTPPPLTVNTNWRAKLGQ